MKTSEHCARQIHLLNHYPRRPYWLKIGDDRMSRNPAWLKRVITYCATGGVDRASIRVKRWKITSSKMRSLALRKEQAIYRVSQCRLVLAIIHSDRCLAPEAPQRPARLTARRAPPVSTDSPLEPA